MGDSLSAVATIVVPFRGESDKSRIAAAVPEARAQLALAMLEDVLSACTPVGRTLLVTSREAEAAHALADALGVEFVTDPGKGQGEAVVAALVLAGEGPILVVNADLPCATSRDLLALLGAMPAAGMALVRAADGTTNALALAAGWLFAPLYGPGSAGRFAERAQRLGVAAVEVDLPNLAGDVDSLADLERLECRVGSSTETSLISLRAPLAR
jgi:2-phospho-L-lactate/phosphoenolpyruvate guanylyltransferase